jgi:hypothetical protein
MVAERFPVEPGHVSRFARALGCADPEPGTAVAVPPTYTAASVDFDPQWWLRPVVGEPWFGSGRTSGEPGTGRGLHAEQHFTYHRPVRLGVVLHGQFSVGESWQKKGRGGLLTFTEETTQWRDDAGELVITERRVRVVTEAPPDASGS